MRIKQVSVRDGLDGSLVPLALFCLDGDTVTAQWQNESYRRDIEQNGIVVLVGNELKRLRPDDGKLFFDSLDLAYWQSSLMMVEEIKSREELERRFAELDYVLSNMAAQGCELPPDEVHEYEAIRDELKRRNQR